MCWKRNRCLCYDLHGGKGRMPVGLSRSGSACDTWPKPYCYARGCGAELPNEHDLRSPPCAKLGSSSTRMRRISTVICYASSLLGEPGSPGSLSKDHGRPLEARPEAGF